MGAAYHGRFMRRENQLASNFALLRRINSLCASLAMVETQRPWDVSVAEWTELFARNERKRLADLALSERLGAELLASLGGDDVSQAA